jgi:polyphosphate kinase 2
VAKKKRRKPEDARPRLGRKAYERELKLLQVRLSALQESIKAAGLRAVVLFEGRDAAGKGGAIKRITERVSPRVFRTVALPAPSERERTQIYAQRYIAHLPAAGEVVLFDRSWYNRAGVERVMGFCTEQQVEDFLRYVPDFERWITEQGIHLVKYWFNVSYEEQQRRFRQRMTDPRKHWKLSPMDLESARRWYDYSRARDEMLKRTNTQNAPWHVVPADDKRRARLNCIAHLLDTLPCEEANFDIPELPDRDTHNAYDDVDIQYADAVPLRF